MQKERRKIVIIKVYREVVKMSYVKGQNREEYQMVCLEELIEEDAKVRVIDIIVENLKPEEIGYKEREKERKDRKVLHKI